MGPEPNRCPVVSLSLRERVGVNEDALSLRERAGVRGGATLTSLFFLLALLGCSKPKPAEFVLNLEGRDPAQIKLSQSQAVAETLARLFGTPDQPELPEGVNLDLDLLAAAAGAVAGDAQGNQRGLFRRHCAGCHGLSGDGAGPAAGALDPYPRDYRDGIFKFTSTSSGAKPCWKDLERVLLRGIPGTAMPSFVQLPRHEIKALIEYVKCLSIRGQTELTLLQLVVDENEPVPLDMELAMKEAVMPAAESWDAPEKQGLIVSPPRKPPLDAAEALAASVARGREVYLKKDAQCFKCHGPEGAGDGEETELYDDWNKRKKGVTPEQTAKLARRFTLPIQRLRARNFQRGIFLGGSGPEDLYWRICVGIKGTPMPAAGPAPGSSGALSAEEIWPLVDYVRWLAWPTESGE